MKRITRGKLLVVAIVFQVAILAAMFVNANLPLWVGERIVVETTPVDPRSLFRGNYARLSYPFSVPESSYFESLPRIRAGEYVYVVLEPDSKGVYQMVSLTLDKPSNGVFIRGRAKSDNSRRLVFGIEAYFTPVEEALALEKTLVGGAYATINVASTGKAALSAVTDNIK